MSLFALFTLLSPRGGAADVEDTAGDEPASDELVDPDASTYFDEPRFADWVEAGEEAEVDTIVPPDWVAGHTWVTYDFSASFGQETCSWSAGPVALPPSLALRERVVVPEAAWLDDRAADFLTPLRTWVTIGEKREELPLAWIAWIDGVPRVWTSDQALEGAPYGVMSPELQAFASGFMEPDERLLPPSRLPAVREVSSAGEENSLGLDE